jgi:hypothetical protein
MAYYDGFLVILALSSCLLSVVLERRDASAASIHRPRPWSSPPSRAGAGATSAAAAHRAPDLSFERVEADQSS